METNGDGAVNFYSRVQMYLFKARQRAREEYAATLEKYGVTEEQVREFVAKHPWYGHPLWLPPHLTAGTSTDLIEHVAPLMGKSPIGRAKVHASRFVKGAKTAVTKTWPKRLHTARRVAPHLPALGRYIASELTDSLPGPKEAWNRLVNRVTALTEDEERQVREAEAAMASAPAPAERQSVGLPVV